MAGAAQHPGAAVRTGAALLGTGALHLLFPRPFDGLIPRALPGPPRAWTLGSGIVELGVGALLLHPRTRRAGGWAAAALFVAVWPGNLTMAWRARSASPARKAVAWGRLPLQLPLIAVAVRIARSPRARAPVPPGGFAFGNTQAPFLR